MIHSLQYTLIFRTQSIKIKTGAKTSHNLVINMSDKVLTDGEKMNRMICYLTMQKNQVQTSLVTKCYKPQIHLQGRSLVRLNSISKE